MPCCGGCIGWACWAGWAPWVTGDSGTRFILLLLSLFGWLGVSAFYAIKFFAYCHTDGLECKWPRKLFFLISLGVPLTYFSGTAIWFGRKIRNRGPNDGHIPLVEIGDDDHFRMVFSIAVSIAVSICWNIMAGPNVIGFRCAMALTCICSLYEMASSKSLKGGITYYMTAITSGIGISIYQSNSNTLDSCISTCRMHTKLNSENKSNLLFETVFLLPLLILMVYLLSFLFRTIHHPAPVNQANGNGDDA